MERVLILAGDGLNCEIETAWACEQVGLKPEIRHLNDLIAEKIDQAALQSRYRAVVIPGGFSFGDEWGSGRILAVKMRDHLKWDLRSFARAGGWVLGICNGFQALIRLGVFGPNVSITHNRSGQFIDRWERLQVTAEQAWLEGGGYFQLPIRHGEGQIVVAGDRIADPSVEVALRYENCPNGSWKDAAGLSTEQGRVLGMMPHPEAAARGDLVPGWNAETADQPGPGAWIFVNLKRAIDAHEGKQA